MEDFAYILDYPIQGMSAEHGFKREPMACAIGCSEFKLLELVPKPNAAIQIGDKAYIGKDMEKRTVVLHVKRRISYSEMTSTAQSELPYIIQQIIKEDEPRFIKFYNEAQPISTRFHMLELLPGLGKKTMWAIIEERKKESFKDFKDIEKRVSLLKSPEKLIAKRIELEISNPNEKYHLFTTR
ncbi:MAG: DUF655 domain-containing protein [Thermoplasmata archaeon]